MSHIAERTGSRAGLQHGHSPPPCCCALLVVPDQWLHHPLMVWNHSIALISEQQAGLAHSGTRLQTLGLPLSFLSVASTCATLCAFVCDNLSVCVRACMREERESEGLYHTKYWLCYLLLLTSGTKAGKSIQKGSRMLCQAGLDWTVMLFFYLAHEHTRLILKFVLILEQQI